LRAGRTEGLTGSRSSDGALVKRGGGLSELYGGTFRFGAGTRIEDGTLLLYPGATLVSNVDVQGTLMLFGTVRGNVSNHGMLFGNQYCDDDTTGLCEASAGRIEGNLAQSPGATMRLTLGMPLTVTGQAALAGNVELVPQRTSHFAPYVLPGAGTRQALLVAAGGVSGTFAQWQTTGSWGASPGVFLEGALGYGPNEVYFDVARSSFQATMSAADAGKSVVQAGAVLDGAFAHADPLAVAPAAALSAAQRRFLVFSGALQHIDSIEQAHTSLSGASGASFLDAVDSAAAEAAMAGLVAKHALDADRAEPAWQATAAGVGMTGAGRRVGSALRFGAGVSGATLAARSDMPVVQAWLRWNGPGRWHAALSTAYQSGDVLLSRELDFAGQGQWDASTQPRVGILQADAELGRTFLFSGVRVVPYAAMAWSRMHTDALRENGATGFELQLPGMSRARWDADLGMRLQGRAGPLQLQAAAGYRQALQVEGAPSSAHFTGLPDYAFALPDAGRRGTPWAAWTVSGQARAWRWRVGQRWLAADDAGAGVWELVLGRAY
jgi:hypothetical protein